VPSRIRLPLVFTIGKNCCIEPTKHLNNSCQDFREYSEVRSCVLHSSFVQALCMEINLVEKETDYPHKRPVNDEVINRPEVKSHDDYSRPDECGDFAHGLVDITIACLCVMHQ
jgi:hypothetical protein